MELTKQPPPAGSMTEALDELAAVIEQTVPGTRTAPDTLFAYAGALAALSNIPEAPTALVLIQSIIDNDALWMENVGTTVKHLKQITELIPRVKPTRDPISVGVYLWAVYRRCETFVGNMRALQQQTTPPQQQPLTPPQTPARDVEPKELPPPPPPPAPAPADEWDGLQDQSDDKPKHNDPAVKASMKQLRDFADKLQALAVATRQRIDRRRVPDDQLQDEALFEAMRPDKTPSVVPADLIQTIQNLVNAASWQSKQTGQLSTILVELEPLVMLDRNPPLDIAAIQWLYNMATAVGYLLERKINFFASPPPKARSSSTTRTPPRPLSPDAIDTIRKKLGPGGAPATPPPPMAPAPTAPPSEAWALLDNPHIPTVEKATRVRQHLEIASRAIALTDMLKAMINNNIDIDKGIPSSVHDNAALRAIYEYPLFDEALRDQRGQIVTSITSGGPWTSAAMDAITPILVKWTNAAGEQSIGDDAFALYQFVRVLELVIPNLIADPPRPPPPSTPGPSTPLLPIPVAPPPPPSPPTPVPSVPVPVPPPPPTPDPPAPVAPPAPSPPIAPPSPPPPPPPSTPATGLADSDENEAEFDDEERARELYIRIFELNYDDWTAGDEDSFGDWYKKRPRPAALDSVDSDPNPAWNAVVGPIHDFTLEAVGYAEDTYASDPGAVWARAGILLDICINAIAVAGAKTGEPMPRVVPYLLTHLVDRVKSTCDKIRKSLVVVPPPAATTPTAPSVPATPSVPAGPPAPARPPPPLITALPLRGVRWTRAYRRRMRDNAIAAIGADMAWLASARASAATHQTLDDLWLTRGTPLHPAVALHGEVEDGHPALDSDLWPAILEARLGPATTQLLRAVARPGRPWRALCRLLVPLHDWLRSLALWITAVGGQAATVEWTQVGGAARAVVRGDPTDASATSFLVDAVHGIPPPAADGVILPLSPARLSISGTGAATGDGTFVVAAPFFPHAGANLIDRPLPLVTGGTLPQVLLGDATGPQLVLQIPDPSTRVVERFAYCPSLASVWATTTRGSVQATTVAAVPVADIDQESDEDSATWAGRIVTWLCNGDPREHAGLVLLGPYRAEIIELAGIMCGNGAAAIGPALAALLSSPTATGLFDLLPPNTRRSYARQ